MTKSRTLLFSASFFALLSLFIVRLLMSHGATIGNYFVTHDWSNTAMDFFNPLVFFSADDPYSTDSNYPAFAACMFKFFRLFLPDGAPLDAAALRVYLPAQMVYISFVLVCILIIGYSVLTMTASLEKWKRVLLSTCVFFSGPLLFALERGNVVLLAFALSFFFLAEYKSESKPVRWIAYSALAIAAGLKIYPCVFALLVFRESKREFVGLCALIAIALILPFFAFDGFESMKRMIGGFFLSSNEQLSRGLGHQYSFTFLIRDVAALAGVRVEEVSSVVQIGALLACLCVFVFARDEWARVFVLSLACVWTPGFAATYSLLFLIPAAILFIVDEQRADGGLNSVQQIVLPVAFAIAIAPQALPRVQGAVLAAWPTEVSPLTGGELVVLAAMMVIFVSIVVTSIRQRIG